MKKKFAPCFDFVYVQEVLRKKVGKKAPRELMHMFLGLKAGKRIKSNFPPEALVPHLVLAVEAAVIVANSFGVSIQEDLPRHFPNMCGYCHNKPCKCDFLKEKPKRLILDLPPVWGKSLTVEGFQAMEFGIYPKSRTREGILEMALHFEDEVKELCIELNRPEIVVPDLVAETCDLIEKPFNLASILGISLAPYLQQNLAFKRKKT